MNLSNIKENDIVTITVNGSRIIEPVDQVTSKAIRVGDIIFSKLDGLCINDPNIVIGVELDNVLDSYKSTPQPYQYEDPAKLRIINEKLEKIQLMSVVSLKLLGQDITKNES